jgi:hypothetical protein
VLFHLGSLLYQGELREVSRQVPELLASAKGEETYTSKPNCERAWILCGSRPTEPDEGARQARKRQA